MENFKHILYDFAEGIVTITLNRPQVLNALNSEVFTEMGQVIDRAGKDDLVRVLLITGGEKVFAAGADIAEMSVAQPMDIYRFSAVMHETLGKIEALGKPVIAVINGYALGGGLELALACDLRIASETAKFGLPEINLGIFPGGGGTQRLPRLVGIGRAKELIYTGEMISADTAFRMGLVNRVVPVGQAMDEGKKLAQKLVAKGAVALLLAKVAVNTGLDTDLASGITIERQCFALLFSTEDQKEGMSAFLEKRKANFTGK